MIMHIGYKVKAVMKQKQVSVKELSEMIKTDYSNTYRILKRQNIDIILLQRISKALDYDFFLELSKDFSDIDE